MKKNLSIGIIMVALVAGPLYADALAQNSAPTSQEAVSADKDTGRWGKRGDRHFDRMAEVLQLTPEQQSQIKSIRTETREKTAPFKQQMRDLRQEMRQTSSVGTFDEDVVRSLAEDQAEIRTELMVEKARMRSRIHAILTPEQREKAEELRQMRGERRHGRKSPR